MEWIIGSIVATFTLAWVVSRLVAKHQFLKEEADRQREMEKTKAWIEYLKTLQGGQHG